MQYLEAHPFARFLPETAPAGDERIVVEHAARLYTAPFTGLAVFRVEDILHRPTGTGRAGQGAAAAFYAAFVVFIPDRTLGDGRCQVVRDMDFHIVFFHVIGCHVASSFGMIFQGSRQGFIRTVHIIHAIFKIDSRIIIGAHVGTHRHAEAAVKGMVTAHDDEFHLVPQSLIVVIFRPVLEEHIIESFHGMQIAAAQENDGSFFGKFRFLHAVFRKVEQHLTYRNQDFFKGIIRPCVPDDIGGIGHFAITDDIGFGKPARTGKYGRSVHIVRPGPGFKGVGQSPSAQLIPHSVTFFLLYSQETITKKL